MYKYIYITIMYFYIINMHFFLFENVGTGKRITTVRDP